MARILREGRADPSQLLAVTFTHRAAREMKDRLAEMLREDPGGARIRVCTLHALGLDLLRSWWTSLGYEGVPFVLDEEARQRQLREAVGRDLPALSARALPGLLEKISRWRQTLGGDGPHDESLVAQAARAYEAALRRLGLLDYDDLLALPLQALEQREDLRAQLRSWLRYLFVDEFQDLNPLQIRLLHRLLPPGAHLTAIGDPDQSIYGFRGVDPSHMLDFPGQFPGARVLRLEDNYRSTGTIVEAASAVISHNPSPLPRRLVAIRDTGPPVQCHVFGTERAEALFVAHEINALMGGTSHWAMRRADRGGGDSSPHLSFADMAVLYRFHALAQPVEETLGREGIPCQRYGDRQLRGDPAWDALMAAFRWLVDPGRDSDLARCLCLPSVGLSPEARHRVDQWASGSPCGLWERLSRGESIDGLSDRDAVQLRLQIRSLGNLLGDASGAPVSHTVRRTLQCLRLSVPDPAASGNPVSEAMRRLVSSAGQWQGDLVSWVDHWSLQEEADLYHPRSQRVALLSVHAAKGLEFDVVFVVGCEDGIFPMEARDASLEEERRLFFVAMTRARHRLYLSRARSRRLRGGRREGPASRFLAEIPPHLIWVHEDDPPPPVPQGAEQLRLF
jgi:DNA helicase-2/ATP-dependent DNA helicase PcrA